MEQMALTHLAYCSDYSAVPTEKGTTFTHAFNVSIQFPSDDLREDDLSQYPMCRPALFGNKLAFFGRHILFPTWMWNRDSPLGGRPQHNSTQQEAAGTLDRRCGDSRDGGRQGESIREKTLWLRSLCIEQSGGTRRWVLLLLVLSSLSN